MQKFSIRQPLVLYALVFMVLVAFAVLTVASFSLVTASRRAYRRAALEEVRALASDRRMRDLERVVAAAPPGERSLEVISASRPNRTVTLEQARRATLTPRAEDPFVAVPIIEPGVEAFLVARFDPQVPTAIAFAELSRTVPIVLVTALALAAILAFLMARLLLPPLDALAAVATDPKTSVGLTETRAPTEIHDVARRFRHTVRLLDEERTLAESQRDELERMQRSLVRASKLASVGRLAAGIAHEIGNPLAAVKGYLSLLRGGLPEAQREEVLVRSVKELDRIHETILKLLTYARTGEDTSEQPAPFELARCVDDAITLVRGHPSMRDVAVRVDLPDRPYDALGHASRLGQVLVNLLLNAAHATEATRETRAPRIEVGVEAEPTGWILTVSDNGPGIPEDQAEHIFDPFFTTKDPGEGTGLGLAVSRALMEAMQGDLVLRDGTEAGAVFEVRVPRSNASTSPD